MKDFEYKVYSILLNIAYYYRKTSIFLVNKIKSRVGKNVPIISHKRRNLRYVRRRTSYVVHLP